MKLIIKIKPIFSLCHKMTCLLNISEGYFIFGEIISEYSYFLNNKMKNRMNKSLPQLQFDDI